MPAKGKTPKISELGKLTANWTIRKYGKDSLYMLLHTHEVTEGYIEEQRQDLTEAQERKVINQARKIIEQKLGAKYDKEPSHY